MKLDKEFKSEFNDEFSKTKYILRKIVVWCIAVTMLFSIGATGVSYAWKYIDNTMDRIIFKQGLAYNEGVLDDLAKYKLEMIRAETDIEKKAIANMVVDRFANYDEGKIETYDLKQFLKDCRNLDLDNY